jgi:hypothetical protein
LQTKGEAYIVDPSHMAEHKKTTRSFYTHDKSVDGVVKRCLSAHGCLHVKHQHRLECTVCAALLRDKSFRKCATRFLLAGNMTRRGTMADAGALRRRCRALSRKLVLVSQVVAGRMSTTFVTEAFARGDLKAVARRLKRIATSGVLAPKKQTTTTLVADIISNLVKEPQGRRWSQTSKAVLGVVRATGGEVMFNMLSTNYGLSSERSARRWFREDGEAPWSRLGLQT